jgi:hypothetical protein
MKGLIGLMGKSWKIISKMDDVYDVFLTFLKPEKKWMVPETDPSGGVCGDPMVDQQV